MNEQSEYPENHVDEDGTVVRYRWDALDARGRPRASFNGDERRTDFDLVYNNVLRVLCESGPLTFSELRDSILWNSFQLSVLLSRMRDINGLLYRDGKWRVEGHCQIMPVWRAGQVPS